MDSLIAGDVHIRQLLKHLRLARDEVTLVVKKNPSNSKNNNNIVSLNDNRGRANASHNEPSLNNSYRASGDCPQNSVSSPRVDNRPQRFTHGKDSFQNTQLYSELGSAQSDRFHGREASRISPEREASWKTVSDYDRNIQVGKEGKIMFDLRKDFKQSYWTRCIKKIDDVSYGAQRSYSKKVKHQCQCVVTMS